MTRTQGDSGGLLIVAGHSIYVDGRWIGGFPGEERFYGLHVKEGIRRANAGEYDKVAFSGGPTRPNLEAETGGMSEAEGMVNYGLSKGLIREESELVIVEPWARDSMENLFFSLLAYFVANKQWPSRVGVVSWASKGLRFHLIASGLRLGGRIFFHGTGDYPQQHDLERACAAEARFNAALVDTSLEPPAYKLVDPLLRHQEEFARKRWARMPNQFTPDASGNSEYIAHVKDAYGVDKTIRELIDEVERLRVGDSWRHIEWPWLT